MSDLGRQRWAKVPDQFKGGLELYIDEGVLPGNALTALLENDLKGTYNRFDDYANILPLLQWLYWGAPAPSWGSPVAVASWNARGGAMGVMGRKVAVEGLVG